jgi:cytochrome c556
MRMTVAVAALVIGSAAVSQAHAQAKPEVLVKQRQAGMTMMAKYFGPIGAMVQGKIPYNADVVARNGSYLEVLVQLPWDGFQPSTEGVKDTRVKPETYRDMAKFKKRAESLQEAMAKLVSAAKARDEGAVKAAFGGVGKTCKGCHDDFRKD